MILLISKNFSLFWKSLFKLCRLWNYMCVLAIDKDGMNEIRINYNIGQIVEW